MKDVILSAHKKPFKLERHCQNAIKGKPGYVVEKRENGFVGVKKQEPNEIVAGSVIVSGQILESYQNSTVASRAERIETEDLSGKDVICPGCGGRYYTTTKEYAVDVNANPAMLDLKKRYKDWGWDELVKDSSMGYGCLVCPECGAALAPSGRLRVE